ncbi:MAG: hypothetical protein ACKO4N_00535, partial [Verrucomicrobiota bacterium]
MSTNHDPLNRRAFIKSSGIALFSAASFTPTEAAAQPPAGDGMLQSALNEAVASAAAAAGEGGGSLDLSPAKWLWYPGDRTLPNTFV